MKNEAIYVQTNDADQNEVVAFRRAGDGTISSYAIGSDGTLELANPVAAATRLGEAGVRDEAITRDGDFLYALDADAQRVHGWRIGADGSLAEIGSFDGLPATVAGLAAS